MVFMSVSLEICPCPFFSVSFLKSLLFAATLFPKYDNHIYMQHLKAFIYIIVPASPNNTYNLQFSISPTTFWTTTDQPLSFHFSWWYKYILSSEWLQSIISSVLHCLLEFLHSISSAIMLSSYLAVSRPFWCSLQFSLFWHAVAIVF